MIAIVNYGSGNTRALQHVFQQLGHDSIITGDPGRLAEADKLVLPGVGAFDPTMKMLNTSGLRKVLDRRVLEHHVPVLGICVGMQIMGKGSEEGCEEGLGWIAGDVCRLTSGAISPFKLPHMGWNEVYGLNDRCLFRGILSNKFYFLHSYFFRVTNEDSVLARVRYGTDFACAIRSNSIFGVQFHPEKSHKAGVQLLNNFANI